MIHRSFDRMHMLKRSLLLSLLLLAAARQASPQTAGTDPPTGQRVAHQIRKSANSRNAAASAGKASHGLCFEPGVGWRRDFPEQPGRPGETAASLTDEIKGSTGVQDPPSNADRPFGDRSLRKGQTQSSECAGVTTKQNGLSRTLLATGSTKPGAPPSLQAHSPDHAHGSTALAKGTRGVMPSTPGDFIAGNKADGNPDQTSIRPYHAYISSIKLRRLIRHAPDFRTRIQLQQLENHPAKQLHPARAGANKGRREGERPSRSASLKSDASAPAQNPQSLLSGTDR
jgi:hypothetical protein